MDVDILRAVIFFFQAILNVFSFAGLFTSLFLNHSSIERYGFSWFEIPYIKKAYICGLINYIGINGLFQFFYLVVDKGKVNILKAVNGNYWIYFAVGGGLIAFFGYIITGYRIFKLFNLTSRHKTMVQGLLAEKEEDNENERWEYDKKKKDVIRKLSIAATDKKNASYAFELWRMYIINLGGHPDDFEKAAFASISLCEYLTKNDPMTERFLDYNIHEMVNALIETRKYEALAGLLMGISDHKNWIFQYIDDIKRQLIPVIGKADQESLSSFLYLSFLVLVWLDYEVQSDDTEISSDSLGRNRLYNEIISDASTLKDASYFYKTLKILSNKGIHDDIIRRSGDSFGKLLLYLRTDYVPYNMQTEKNNAVIFECMKDMKTEIKYPDDQSTRSPIIYILRNVSNYRESGRKSG